MVKSLADLRAAPPQTRPERSVTVCLAPHLVAEVQTLTTEANTLAQLLERETRSPEEPQSGPPRRQGQGETAEVKAARARQAEVQDRLLVLIDDMAEHEGEMRLRANLSDGEWRRWVNEHPARAEGEPGYDRDQRVTYGFCDADALLDALGDYAYAWNDDLLSGEDWARVFEPTIATADKAQMAQAVVTMYESRLDFQQLRSSLSGNLRRLNGSGSPAPSESPTHASTAKSPARSNGATTSKAAKSA